MDLSNPVGFRISIHYEFSPFFLKNSIRNSEAWTSALQCLRLWKIRQVALAARWRQAKVTYLSQETASFNGLHSNTSHKEGAGISPKSMHVLLPTFQSNSESKLMIAHKEPSPLFSDPNYLAINTFPLWACSSLFLSQLVCLIADSINLKGGSRPAFWPSLFVWLLKTMNSSADCEYLFMQN